MTDREKRHHEDQLGLAFHQHICSSPLITQPITGVLKPSGEIYLEGGLHLNEYVSPPYQSSLRAWLTQPPPPRERSLLFPIDLTQDLVTRQIWIRLDLFGSTLVSGETPVLIQQVQSALYAERLAARSAGFTGFHHDLANRLFLFKSIPQLAGFSSPEELFEDLNGELPTLIHFLENRLNKSWIGDEPLETVSDLSSLNAVMTEWLNDPLIKRYLQFHIEDGLNIPRFPCTGLFWSITQLVLRLKRGELPHLAASSHIALKISTAPDLPLGTVGAAGFLSPSSPTLQVTLSIEGMNSGEWARAWRDGLGWDFSSRSARLKSPAPREAAACWFGSWVNAAHQVNGIIVTRDHDLDIIF